MDTQDSVERWKFLVPEILYGIDTRLLAGRYAKNLGMSKVLLVSDEGVTEAGWPNDVSATLTDVGITVIPFNDVTPNPKDYEVMRGAALYRESGCDGIITVGGGSPMDCAKGIAIIASNSGEITDYEGVDTIPHPCPPLICIPTTAGTSADVSQFCIITNTESKVKIAIVSRAAVPDLALVDPVTTTTMDKALTAATGIDAFVHATEALASSARSSLTDVHALKAANLVFNNLITAIEKPMDMEARSYMMLGSLHAGLAFSNASLGAVHAMAHALGGLLDLAHGNCNAILLPYVVDQNFSSCESQYRKLAEMLGISTSELSLDSCREQLFSTIQAFKTDAGISDTLETVGVTLTDIPNLARAAVKDACMVTNPCPLNESDVEKLYVRAL